MDLYLKGTPRAQHTYITSRPFPIGIERDHFLLRAIIHTPFAIFTFINFSPPLHPRFIPEEVAEASQIFLRDAHVLPQLFSYE
jgi:hypothetical protein